MAVAPKSPVLPDVLADDLDVVFCGTAAGRTSALCGCYYARRGNLFWPTLGCVGIAPPGFGPNAFRDAPLLGFGLTDLNKTEFGQDRDLSAAGWDLTGFVERMRRWRPRRIAFTSKTAAAVCLGVATGSLLYGRQRETLAAAAIWVLPSPSGQARKYWSEEPWRALARDIARRRADAV